MKFWKYLSYLFFASWLIVASSAQAASVARCVVLDVGEGQAVLLQMGNSGLLLDTGHFGKSHDVLRSLEQYGVDTIEAVILTHLHPDHASGIFTIQSHYPGAVIYESGHRLADQSRADSYRWTVEKLDSAAWQVENLIQGDSLQWHGFSLNVLWPPSLKTGGSLNELSLALSITYNSTSILVMGDIGVEQEKVLLRQDGLPEHVDVLVVGHHGAHDATSKAMLQRVAPKKAVVSVNYANFRGYPHSSVIERLQESGAVVHQTWKDGDFVLDIDP